MNDSKRRLFLTAIVGCLACQRVPVTNSNNDEVPRKTNTCNIVVPPKGFSLRDMQIIVDEIIAKEESDSPNREVVILSIEVFSDGRIEVVVADEATVEAGQMHYVFRWSRDSERWMIESSEAHI